MVTAKKIGKIYEEIEKKICNMIPEKWDKVYLYVSIIDGINKIETGEMFFYYYPKSVIKKNPINVYEVPGKFNLEDEMYLKLADSLYHEIQRLRENMIKMGEEPWSNLTISIESFQFKVEFDYEDLRKSEFSDVERNLIWQFKYLRNDLSAYRRKERKILERYLEREQINKRKTKTYVEPFYVRPETNIVDFNTEYREKLKILAAEEDKKAKLREAKKLKKQELLENKKNKDQNKIKASKIKKTEKVKLKENDKNKRIEHSEKKNKKDNLKVKNKKSNEDLENKEEKPKIRNQLLGQ